MKLKLNKSLRRALYSLMLAVSASTTTLGATSLLLGHFVSYSLLAQSSLDYAGSLDASSASELTWSTDSAQTSFSKDDAPSSFANGDHVSFTGHTDATLGENISVGNLTVADDGSLDVTGAYTLNISNAALNNADVSVTSTSSTNSNISTITGTGSLTLSGNYTFTGDVDYEGDIILQYGTTYFGTGQYNVQTLNADSITILSGAGLTVTQSNNNLKDTDMNLIGGRLHSGDLDGAEGVQFGTLTTSGASVISHQWNGTFSFEKLTGSGTISLYGIYQYGYYKFDGVENFNGTIDRTGATGNTELQLSGIVNQDAASQLQVNAGNSSVSNLVITGEGGLSFAGAVTMSGSNVQLSGTAAFSAINFSAAGDSYNLLGGTLQLSSSDYSNSNGVLRMGAGIITATQDTVSLGKQIQLGAHDASAYTSTLPAGYTAAAAGTEAAPIYSVLQTTKAGAATGSAMSISGAITDAAGSVGALRILGTGSVTLSGTNSFSGGIELNESTLILGNATAAGTGTIRVGGGTLNAGGMAAGNTVDYSSGSITGMGAFTGQLNVNAGSLSLDAISGSLSVASGASLTLTGAWDYVSAISNAGSVTLGAGLVIDLSGALFVNDGTGKYELSLVSDASNLITDAWLSSGSLNMSNVLGLVEGRSYSYENGIISYISTANSHVINTSTSLGVGTLIGEEAFAQLDNVAIGGLAATVTLTESLQMGELSMLGLSSQITGAAEHSLSVESLTVNSGTSVISGIAFEANHIQVAGGTLTIESGLGDARVALSDSGYLQALALESAIVDLETGAHLVLTEALASGEVLLNTIMGGADSELSLSLAADGTDLVMSNFSGKLNLDAGMMNVATSQMEELAAFNLKGSSILRITDMLGTGTHDLSKVSGAEDSTLSLSGVGNLTASGGDNGDFTTLILSNDFDGKLQVNAGLIHATSSNLGGSKGIALHGGGIVFTTTGSLATDVHINDGAVGTLRAYSAATGTITGAVTGSASATINKTDSGVIVLNDLTGFTGTLNVQDGKAVIGSSASLAGLGLSKGMTIEVAAGDHTVTVSGSTDAPYTRSLESTNSTDNLCNIIVGAGATLDDNVYLRLKTGTVTISGGGTYEITKFMGADYSATQSVLRIESNTTLRVSDESTTGDSGAAPAFMLGHWGGGAKTTVNIAGTLELNSGISNKDGSGVINVEDGGSLILRKGLYAVDADNHPGALSINAASGSTVKLHNQSTATAAGVLVADFAGGSTIMAMDEVTSITNALRFSGSGDVTMTADASVELVHMSSSITAAAGSTAGLSFVGTRPDSDIQTYAVDAANSYAGDTSITNAEVFAGNALAFGTTGSIIVNSGTLNLNDHAVSNDVTAVSGSLKNFSAYTGNIQITGNVSGSDMAGTLSVASAASLTLDGTWLYSSSITNAGSVTFDSSLLIDLNNLDFTRVGDVYSLTLVDGGVITTTGWLNEDGSVDTTKLTGVLTTNRDFSFADGVLSYTLHGKNLEWAGGNGTWSAAEGNAGWLDGSTPSSYTSTDLVTFGASSSTENTISLEGSLSPAELTVRSEQNYSFAGTGSLSGETALIKDGTGTLTITMENSYSGGTQLRDGTLRIQDMNALGSGALEITGGTLALYGGTDVVIDAQSLALSSGLLKVALESTNASLTNANSLGSHALHVSGAGTFTHDKWSTISSVDVGAGATVSFTEANVNTTGYKTISGEGHIQVAHSSAFNAQLYLGVQFDADNGFTGTFELANSAKIIMKVDDSSADHRTDLVLNTSSELALTSDGASTLYLNSLSGEGLIRFDWSPTVSRHLDLELSEDQIFAGSIKHHGDARMGNFTIGSLERAHHTFTFSGAGASTVDNRSDYGNLIINNATVSMTNNAVWNGGIRLTTADSVLQFNGNATTRDAGSQGISGLGSVHVNADTTLNGANSYSGTTLITGATLTVGEVSALGTSAVTVNSGTLNLGGLAVSNNVTAAGGSLAGFSAYEGALSVTGDVSVADTITGGISISDAGSLTLSGTWDFSSAMTNDGMLTFADSLTLDLSDSSFDGSNNLVLFTGSGSANIDSWLTNNSSNLASSLSGIDTTGKTFSYADGVLSYTLRNIIDTDENESFTGPVAGEITFKDETGTASLGEGFAQDASSTFKGAGTIQVTAGADVVLSSASTEFTGTTELEAGSAGDATELTIAHADAVGEGNLQLADHSSIKIASGVVLDNDLTHENGNAQLLTGGLTVSGRADDSTSYSSGATSTGNLVENVMLTNADVDLADNGDGAIRNTTLTNTAVTLGDGSELTLENVTLGLGTTITNSSATLRFAGNVEIEAATGNGLDAGRLVPDLETLEGGTQEMLVYKLTAITVAENIIAGTLTLDITLSGDDLTAFKSAYLTDGAMIAFELNGVSKDEYQTDYRQVTIIVSDGTNDLYHGAALGHTLVDANVALYIPEPSTATLSLLALAGMLLRRRRKLEA